jgi:hypothetical protein
MRLRLRLVESAHYTNHPSTVPPNPTIGLGTGDLVENTQRRQLLSIHSQSTPKAAQKEQQNKDPE